MSPIPVLILFEASNTIDSLLLFSPPAPYPNTPGMILFADGGGKKYLSIPGFRIRGMLSVDVRGLEFTNKSIESASDDSISVFRFGFFLYCSVSIYIDLGFLWESSRDFAYGFKFWLAFPFCDGFEESDGGAFEWFCWVLPGQVFEVC